MPSVSGAPSQFRAAECQYGEPAPTAGAAPVPVEHRGLHILAVKTYRQDHIDGCRARIEAQLVAYDALVEAAGTAKTSGVRSALDAFAPHLFTNLTLVLEQRFT